MISIENLNKSFSSEQILFQDFNLDINEGDNIALIGPSGCGKSTILRYILGMKYPDSGTILIDGNDINHLSDRDMHQLRLSFGMLF